MRETSLCCVTGSMFILLPLVTVNILLRGQQGALTGGKLSVGWYRNEEPWVDCVPPQQIPWESLTHLAIDSPLIGPDYTAHCNDNKTVLTRNAHIAQLGRAHQVKILWVLDEYVFPDASRSEMLNFTKRSAFLTTIGQAAVDCKIDGIDFDYEGWDDPLRVNTSCKTGVGSNCDRDVYTNFINDARQALNDARPANYTNEKTTSLSIINYDIPPYVSWVNPAMFTGDWVSLQTYGNNFDNYSAADYRTSGYLGVRTGLKASMINIGMGLYSSGGEWCQANTAKGCVNLDPSRRFCGYNKTFPCPNRGPWPVGPHLGPDGGCPVPLGGKNSALEIGQMIKEEGFAGAFLFEVDYDTVANNNSIISWLGRGLRGD